MPRFAVRSVLFATGFALALAPAARAQCPDGTPPPCRRPATAATRRAAPPLDDHTWIVLPFENVARVPDVDWLREASVNLLYLDLSRWQDIRVIDDERVADLMREVPSQRAGAQLSLETGLAVARRAGAGKLVMGDLLKIGSRTQVVAKVFDVRSGQRLRTIREETPFPDSIMIVFGRLARGILQVEPPPGTDVGALGTARIEAYQAYLSGVAALNRWRLAEARDHFARALTSDSAFALAHYKLAIVIGWESPSDTTRRVHAEAAGRLGRTLPARERALIAGTLAQSRGAWGDACVIYDRLIAADSSDVEAWYNLGECEYHDPSVDRVEGDSTRLRFHSSWNRSLRAFERALELDPSNHLAFQHIQDALTSSRRNGCIQIVGNRCLNSVVGAVQRAGDSLVTIPVTQTDAGMALRRQLDAAARNGSARANLLEAQRQAQRWLDAGPAEPRAVIANGRIWLRLGQPDSADRYFARSALDGSFERTRYATDRLELAMKLDRWTEAHRLADSMITALRGGTSAELITRGGVEAVFGRFDGLDLFITSQITAPAPILRYFSRIARATAGAASIDSLLPTERAWAAQAGFRNQIAVVVGLASAWTLRARTPADFPLTDTATADPYLRMVSFAALGDVGRTRAAIEVFEEAVPGLAPEGSDPGAWIVAAEARLLIADTAAALRHLERFALGWRSAPFAELVQFPVFSGTSWARGFLLFGDLAEARGQRDVALVAYRRALALRHNYDPELAPQAERARAALARLGG